MRLLSARHFVSPLSTVSDRVNQHNTRVYHSASSRIPWAAQRRSRPGWAAASERVGVGERCWRPTMCTQQPSSSLCCSFHHPRKIRQRPHLFFYTCQRTAMTYHYGIMLTISMHTAAQPSACCDSSQWTTGNTGWMSASEKGTQTWSAGSWWWKHHPAGGAGGRRHLESVQSC